MNGRTALTSVAIITMAISRLQGAGTVAAEFLKFPVGAPTAMSDASGAVVRDSSAIYWNPAGLAALDSADVYAAHNSLPLSVRYDFAAAATPLRSMGLPGGVLAVSAQALTQSAIDALDNTGEPAGSYSATDMAGTLGMGVGRGDFRGGVAVRFVRQSIAGVAGSAIAGDAGLQMDDAPWMFGASVANIGSSLKLGSQSASLPRTFRLGAGLNFFGKDLLLASDLSHVEGVGVRGHVGASYLLWPPPETTSALFRGGGVTARGGYTIGNPRDNARSGAACGLSVQVHSIRTDFSFQPFGELGNSFQFGLGYRF